MLPFRFSIHLIYLFRYYWGAKNGKTACMRTSGFEFKKIKWCCSSACFIFVLDFFVYVLVWSKDSERKHTVDDGFINLLSRDIHRAVTMAFVRRNLNCVHFDWHPDATFAKSFCILEYSPKLKLSTAIYVTEMEVFPHSRWGAHFRWSFECVRMGARERERY